MQLYKISIKRLPEIAAAHENIFFHFYRRFRYLFLAFTDQFYYFPGYLLNVHDAVFYRIIS